MRERRLHLSRHAPAGRLRDHPLGSKQFVVLPDHYTPEIEDVVSKTDSHWIVRKSGDAGDYVEHLDPRSR